MSAAAAWIRLLRRIPPSQVDNLAIVTSAGAELSIQSILRLDEDFLVLRARLTGTSDAGRAFFVPYEQIDFVGTQKSVREEDIRALFDGPDPRPLAEQVVAAPAGEVDSGAMAEIAPQAPAEPPRPAPPAPGPGDARALPTKSKVLANLRARLKAGSGPAAR